MDNQPPSGIHIHAERFAGDFESLSQIGNTQGGGVNRPALSVEHLEARRWLRERAAQAGLPVRQDAAGNQIVRLASPNPDAKTLIIGSHLDSVPNGGRFDGAYGVLAGLEVLRVIKENGLHLPFHVEVVDFTDEEGTLVSFLGSFAMSGKLAKEDLLNPRGGRQAFLEGLRRAGLDEEKIFLARRDPAELAGYLELHVEQSSRLEEAGIPLGVVQVITGIKFFFVHFYGRMDHTGTTAMDRRKDAGLAAGMFITEFYRLIGEQFPGCLGNIGQVTFTPGAFNIVPAEARLMVEVRSGRKDELLRLAEAAASLGQTIADSQSVRCEVVPVGERYPALMDGHLQDLIRKLANANGWQTMSLSSGAGHDAQSFADICPTAVIFIPSRGGVSHAEDEFSTWEDCLRGAELLLQVVLNFPY